MSEGALRIPPFHYIHVLDSNTNVTRLETGPQTLLLQEHEKVASGSTPLKMIVISPNSYVEVINPVIKGADGKVLFDRFGLPRLMHGEKEFRLREQYPEPFPFYPGEKFVKMDKLLVIEQGEYLKIEAVREVTTADGQKRQPGDAWVLEGPCTYVPRVEEEIITRKSKYIVKTCTAMKIRATRDYKEADETQRVKGDEWLNRVPGSYIEGPYEECIALQEASVITRENALHLKAVKNYTDVYGQARKAGEEWLITNDKSATHIIDVFEQVVKRVPLVILDPTQYCVISDPYDNSKGTNNYGKQVIIKGETSFFLQPGESLEGGIRKVVILGDNEALLVRAKEAYKQPRIHDQALKNEVEKLIETSPEGVVLIRNKRTAHVRIGIRGQTELKHYEDEHVLQSGETLQSYLTEIPHKPGDRWMEYGPLSYLPPVQVELLNVVREIPLDKNEGIYVRDTRSGLVRAVIGETYMLKPHEELYEMELPEGVEKLIKDPKSAGVPRDKTKVVTYRCPYNAAVQIYNFKKNESRIVFGPELVMLNPEETITVSALSGKTPKRPGIISTLYILLGPDFSTDICEVETSDHCKLRIQLSYNWYFRVDKTRQEEAKKIFAIKDFVGDLVNIMSAKVRAAVAGVSFDDFHKRSARLIRSSVFGTDEKGKILDEHLFPINNLCVTNVDIQMVEPMDIRTKNSLKETVSLAIEITTKTQEEDAKRQAEKADQENTGQLNKIKIEDDARAEEARRKLMASEIECLRIKNIGEANAEANAISKAALLQAEMELKISELEVEAEKLQRRAAIARVLEKEKVLLEYERKMQDLALTKEKKLSEIEAEKFEKIMADLGQETLIQIASAGPEMQAKLLQGLGLQGYLLTDGTNPINLFGAAQGLIGGAPSQ